MKNEKSYPPIMQAVYLEKPGGPLVTREVKTPVPGPGEVLVKIAAAPVNPSDLSRLRNIQNENEAGTFSPGLEGSGRIVAAGRGLLPNFWLGKRVACSSEYSTSGTWAEYMVTIADGCFPLGRKITDEQGSMSLVNPLTALALIEIARESGSKAIINNAAGSALGRMIELLAGKKHIKVINIVRRKEQADNLKATGSDFVLNGSDPLFIKNLKSLSGELKATMLFDPVCSMQLTEIINILPAGCRVVIYGNLSGEEHIMINPRKLISDNIQISGFYLGSRAKENGIIKNMLNLRAVRRRMTSDMKIKVQARYPFSKAQEAVDTYLKNMSAGKVLLIPGYI